MLTKREMWKYLVTPDVTSLTARERESTNLAAFPFFSYFLFFVLCKMYEKSWVVLLVSCSIVSGFLVFLCRGLGVGGG